MAPPPRTASLTTALVVSAHGRHCVVEADNGQRSICHPRGKKNTVVVGDRVRCAMPPAGQGDAGTIEQVLPRTNLFYRQDNLRTKAFAANIDQVLIWLAAEPEFSHKLLTRALIAAEAAHIAPLVVLNKADLTDAFAHHWQRLTPYRAAGYSVLGVSLYSQEITRTAQVYPINTASIPALIPTPAPAPAPIHGDDWQHLLHALHGKKTLVLGPSGTGKSTLINHLLPHAQVQTAAISQALNSGRHTTSSTHWYWLPRAPDGTATALVDSPGFQEFGLHHIAPADLASYMPDLRAHIPQCRFYNCTHLHEPDCGIRAAVEQPLESGGIAPLRHQLYAELFAELENSTYR